jgi:hypothetical protein
MADRIKSLANCKPSEFIRQTNAIRHYAEKWLKDIKFSEIRKHLPNIPEGATEEEKTELIRKQNFKNFSDMLDSALEEHTEETLGVLALCSFVPIEKADDQPMEFYIEVISDLLESEPVTRFFISLVKLALKAGK